MKAQKVVMGGPVSPRRGRMRSTRSRWGIVLLLLAAVSPLLYPATQEKEPRFLAREQGSTRLVEEGAACPLGDVACCDQMTCSGHGACDVAQDLAVCSCDEGWLGASCNAPEDLYAFGTADRSAVWIQVGKVWVRPPSHREQLLHNLRPGTYFVGDLSLREAVEMGSRSVSMPVVFPDGQVEFFDLVAKDRYVSDIQTIERRAEGGDVRITNRYPEVTVYKTLFEEDGSVRSVMQILAVDGGGGFVGRGLARPSRGSLFSVKVTPVSPTMELDPIEPVDGTIDRSTLLLSEVQLATPDQQAMFGDCNGIALCGDLCADTGLNLGDPGPTCLPPPEPCDAPSPCGEGGGGGGGSSTVNQCNDGIDNDGDGHTDGFDPQCDHSPSCEPGGSIPNHVHRFEAGANVGMFGDVTWCTKQGANWVSHLLDRSYFTETPFHTDTGSALYDDLYRWGNPFYDKDKKLVRVKTIGCWLLPTQQEAEDCADDLADCGPFSAGAHTYPYHFGRDADGMWKGLKVDVWHARSVGMVDPLNLAQTITSVLIGESEAESIPGFASVAGTNVSGPSTSPHELGHTLNLTHCDVEEINGQWTLMGNDLSVQSCPPGDYGSHTLDRFSATSGAKLHACFLGACHPTPKYGDPAP